ncbi:hypothetical protein KIN20_038323 [Parelaphostrongylus tenuis]|uniref:Uncharacterized protein n=1 Tax=Parelaphostrongylus tenuis TaxID=148309 RepID=A0AAD5REQ0_PARTN|nr:hypothetical protein KIN20_038323 [Parelaphostrongylus tenuis]
MENDDGPNLLALSQPAAHRASLFNHRTRKARIRMSEKISKCIIEARCTDNILFAGAAAVGAVVLVLQSLPIFMNNWVFLTEPRPINKTNENGEQITNLCFIVLLRSKLSISNGYHLQESTFHYNVGYFQVCRMHKNNQTGVLYSEYEVSRTSSLQSTNCTIAM